LVNPAYAARTEATVRDVQAAARAMGLELQVLNANTSQEINAAFATFAREPRPDALFVGTDPFFFRAGDPSWSIWRRAMPCPLPTQGGTTPKLGADELRKRRERRGSPGRRLCRPRPQGRKACGPAGRAVVEVRAGHQRRDREDAWHHGSTVAARHRRRGHRMM